MFSRENNMENRISQYEDKDNEGKDRPREPQPIRVILAELLAQYQTRFPEAKIVVMETTATAI
jgi:hypothetical protein